MKHNEQTTKYKCIANNEQITVISYTKKKKKIHN